MNTNWKERACQAENDRDELQAELETAERERDFLIEEYERAVGCGPQGFAHAAGHLFNAIVNVRCDSKVAEQERDELAAHIEQIERAIYEKFRQDDFEEDYEHILKLLDCQPSASLAAHDAELLRRDARKIGPDCDRKTDADILLDNMADAIERGDA